MKRSEGYTMVELMVVVAIIAILASVAVPSYVNYQNRARQSEAIEALLRARMDQESFWSDNNRYANTIGALYSFGNTMAKSADTTGKYRICISSAANTCNFVNPGNPRFIVARRWIGYSSTFDIVTLASGDTSPESAVPQVLRPQALGFSIFQIIFN